MVCTRHCVPCNWQAIAARCAASGHCAGGIVRLGGKAEIPLRLKGNPLGLFYALYNTVHYLTSPGAEGAISTLTNRPAGSLENGRSRNPGCIATRRTGAGPPCSNQCTPPKPRRSRHGRHGLGKVTVLPPVFAQNEGGEAVSARRVAENAED